MAHIENTALRRVQKFCAKITSVLRYLRTPTPGTSRPKIPHIEGVSDRLLRDIGLDPSDMEQQRHQHPSQTTYHPRS